MIGLIGMLGWLQYSLWLDPQGVRGLWQLQQQLQVHQRTIGRLIECNRVLAEEIHDLKNGLGAIEERARNELGMIKKNEVFYRFADGVTESHAVDIGCLVHAE